MKKLLTLVLFVLVSCAVVPGAVLAQDDSVELEKEIKKNPDDTTAFNKYMSKTISALLPVIDTEPAKAEGMLKKMDEFLAVLEPETAQGKQLLLRAKSVSQSLKSRVKLAQTSFEEIQKKLADTPDDKELLNMLVAKASNSAAPLTRSEPEKAEGIIEKAKKVLKDAQEKTENEETKKMIDGMIARAFGRLESSIAAGKKLLALIGQDAAEMNVESWANGEPLAPEDLQGKVVLLDFWAVWCGPCIATFPHLKEWHEKYSEKGLVIVGVTRFYNYEWDEEKGRAMRAKGEVKPEDETAMLEKFAKSYELEHRFAIQNSNELSKYYGVTGIPHAVVIDKKGKIRMIRVGSGEKNAKDIENLLEELLK